MNSGGTAWRASIAARSAPSSRSSSQLSRTWLSSSSLLQGGSGFTADARGQVPGTAQPLQAPGALRADAPDADLEEGADLRIGVRRVTDEHGQQLPAVGRKFGQCGAQGRVPLG